MKVAIVSPYALDRHGGVQDQARGLTRHLRDNGHDAVLVGPGESDGSWISVGNATAIEANDATAPVCLDPFSIQRVKEAIHGADVVHVHEPLLPVVGPAAWIGGDQPTVGTFHAEPGQIVRRIYRHGGPLLGKLIDKMGVLTAASEDAAAAVRGFAPNVEVVPNAVDVVGFPNVPRNGRQVAFVGRDDPRKGLDVLLAAWTKVRASVPDAELVAVGPRRSVTIPGVRFEGAVDDDRKREVLSGSGIYCAPNTGGESFGITLIEGMAAGCAVVASDLPAFLAVAGGAAIHVPVGDGSRLADALVGLLEDPAESSRMGEESRARAGTFDWSMVFETWLSVYRRAIDRTAGRIEG